jgi:hypothetical protein
MTFLPDLRAASKAAVVAAVLGATALAAMPAQAQSPGFSFGFGFGNGGMGYGPGYGPGYRDYDPGFYGRRPYFPRMCMTDFQVRRALQARGYSDIRLNAPRGRLIEARATRGGIVYLITFNRCSGQIVDRQRLRRSGGGGRGY